jgi:hypothetical protein
VPARPAPVKALAGWSAKPLLRLGPPGQWTDLGPRRFGLRQPLGGQRVPPRGAQFSMAMTRNTAIDRAINSIDESAWTSVKYPGAVRDPDTGAWISDAEVAEIGYTASASTKDRGYCPPGSAASQRRPLPRRPVPGVAVSPVPHQHRPADRPSRHHPAAVSPFPACLAFDWVAATAVDVASGENGAAEPQDHRDIALREVTL